MKQWSFYRLSDGTFTGRRMKASADTVALNTPEGCAAIAGRYDPQTQRVDLDTGEVMPYDAPPDPRRERDKAEARIAMLERRQLRPLRELAIDPGNSAARQRVEAIETEIAALRADLGKPTA